MLVNNHKNDPTVCAGVMDGMISSFLWTAQLRAKK